MYEVKHRLNRLRRLLRTAAGKDDAPAGWPWGPLPAAVSFGYLRTDSASEPKPRTACSHDPVKRTWQACTNHVPVNWIKRERVRGDATVRIPSDAK
jgi:hypothetical protein